MKSTCCLLAAGLALILLGGAFPAFAQDIAIIGLRGKEVAVTKNQRFVFQVEISAFSPIKEVLINGEPQTFKESTFVMLTKVLTLEPGRNTVTVKASSEQGSGEKAFTIIYRAPGMVAEQVQKLLKGEPDKEGGFSLILMGALASISNPLNSPKSNANIKSGLKRSLIVVAGYDAVLDSSNIWSFGLIISRDDYAEEEFTPLEAAFTQINTKFTVPFADKDEFTVGLGYNVLKLQFDTILQAKVDTQEDVFTNFKFKHVDKEGDVFSYGLEYKIEEVAAAPAEIDANSDGPKITLDVGVEQNLGAPKLKLGAAVTDEKKKGLLKKRTVTRLSAAIDFLAGSFLITPAVGFRDFKFDFAKPPGLKPDRTLVSYSLTTLWIISANFVLSLSYAQEEQTSDLTEFQYENESTALALIYIF